MSVAELSVAELAVAMTAEPEPEPEAEPEAGTGPQVASEAEPEAGLEGPGVVSAGEPEAGCVAGLVGRVCFLPGCRRVGTVASVTPGSDVGSLRVRCADGGLVVVGLGELVVLPQVGELVELPRGGGRVRGFWLGVRPAAEELDSGGGKVLAVRVLTSYGWVESAPLAGAVHGGLVVLEPAGPGVAAAVAAAGELWGRWMAEREELKVWKRRLSAAACDHADEQGWCGTFDEFMTGWGLSGR